MIFRLTIDFDSNNNEIFKGMTKDQIMDYISELHPQDDSVCFVSISPICERCKTESATTTYANSNVCERCCNHLDDEFDREMS